jgi:peptidoglycan/LPS O-acetylase OafA/YrhL
VLFFAACLLFGISWRFLFPDQFYSLLNCVQFFIPGILSALLFHYRKKDRDPAVSQFITIVLSVLVILLLFVESRSTDVFTQLIYCILLFLLFFFVFSYESGFRKFLRKKFIAYTGGMCYTIYLYHILLLLIFDKFLFNQVRGNIMLVLTGSCIYLICLWFFSVGMYLLFEKPFMKMSLNKW